MSDSRKTIGAFGERLAARHLTEKGYLIIETNYRNRKGRQLGEIDLIAKEKSSEILVFVEVKTRKTSFFDTCPEESITGRKLERLDRIAQAYLREKRLTDVPYRFDAVTVRINAGKKLARIRHIRSL